ncbi:MAG: ferrochelatase [Oligoflexia bacterium]|nr:ferrochelatase [Oligoflexia bacterium]
MAEPKIGILVSNLGTPDSPEELPVRKYLAEFLMDKYIIDIPWILRVLLVYGVILWRRPKLSAHAYAQIWTSDGSPLMVHSKRLYRKLKDNLGSAYAVALAMRYGNPSLESGVKDLMSQGVSEIRFLPLYPQFASATVRSSFEKLKQVAALLGFTGEIRLIAPFFNHPDFIELWAAKLSTMIESEKPDHILFSFHGLPVRQLIKEDKTGSHCMQSPGCCQTLSSVNELCYRAHCLATAQLIAQKLGLEDSQYSIGFQSRLGGTRWIEPYTEDRLIKLAQNGIKNLVVVSPSFVADCLETLEELGIRARDRFLSEGGTKFSLVPSLNSDDPWIRVVSDLVVRPRYLRLDSQRL